MYVCKIKFKIKVLFIFPFIKKFFHISKFCTGIKRGNIVAQREARVAAAEASIGRVLTDFRHVTDAMLRATTLLINESAGIKDEVGQALVQLQFQDRVSQIMNHVKDNIVHLPAFLQEHNEQYAQAGELQPLDAQALLAELKKTYVMADQHVIHHGGSVEQKSGTDISFF